jgi:hypothetical protein
MIRLLHYLHLLLCKLYLGPPTSLPQRRLSVSLLPPSLSISFRDFAFRRMQPIKKSQSPKVHCCLWIERPLVVEVVLPRVIEIRTIAGMGENRHGACGHDPDVERDEVRAPCLRLVENVGEDLGEQGSDESREDVEQDLFPGRAVPGRYAQIGFRLVV